MRLGREGSQSKVWSRACDLSGQLELDPTEEALGDEAESPWNSSTKRQGSWCLPPNSYTSRVEDCYRGINFQAFSACPMFRLSTRPRPGKNLIVNQPTGDPTLDQTLWKIKKNQRIKE